MFDGERACPLPGSGGATPPSAWTSSGPGGAARASSPRCSSSRLRDSNSSHSSSSSSSSKSMASTCSGCRLTACELRAGGWSSVTCLSVSALSAHLGLRLCPSVCSSVGMFCGTSALGAGDVTGIPVASTCTPACLPACLICLHVHLSAGQHPCLHVPRSAGSPACLHACSMLRTLVPSVHVPCLGCIFRYFDVLPLGRAACYLV